MSASPAAPSKWKWRSAQEHKTYKYLKQSKEARPRKGIRQITFSARYINFNPQNDRQSSITNQQTQLLLISSLLSHFPFNLLHLHVFKICSDGFNWHDANLELFRNFSLK